MNVKKTSAMITFYSKFENRLLIVLVAILVALAFAISSAKAAVIQNDDLLMVNASSNIWRSQSADGAGSFAAMKWGVAGDVLVPADFDGDGIRDLAVWRPSNGTWYILASIDGRMMQVKWAFAGSPKSKITEFVPVPADFDGDKRSDLAFWQPLSGKWNILTSKSGFTSSIVVEWGVKGDVPVPADYDGDERTDVAVFRPSQNRWLIAASRSGELVSTVFGHAGEDLLVPADYTGDGRADIAIYRKGTWQLIDSATGELEKLEFGYPDSIPVPADYNGDGTADHAFFHHGSWHIYENGEARLRVINFGSEGEVPLTTLSVKASVVAAR